MLRIKLSDVVNLARLCIYIVYLGYGVSYMLNLRKQNYSFNLKHNTGMIDLMICIIQKNLKYLDHTIIIRNARPSDMHNSKRPKFRS